MNNQPPISIVARLPADYLKRHRQIFAVDGPGMMTPDTRTVRQRAIDRCGDEIISSRTDDQFETALEKAHRLGAFPPNGQVSIVARASVLFAD